MQTELLLDLVAEAQSRRLEEQRATFHVPEGPPNLAPAPARPQEDREQLYSTILSHQVRRPAPQEARPRFPGLLTLSSLGPYPSSSPGICPLQALAPHPSHRCPVCPSYQPAPFRACSSCTLTNTFPSLHPSSASGWKPSGQSLPYPQGDRSSWSCC